MPYPDVTDTLANGEAELQVVKNSGVIHYWLRVGSAALWLTEKSLRDTAVLLRDYEAEVYGPSRLQKFARMAAVHLFIFIPVLVISLAVIKNG